MAKIASLNSQVTDPSEINLTRILSHLENVLLSPDSDSKLLASSFERNRVGANFEYARSLLLRLEHDSANIKIASRKHAVQADLQSKRELIKRLQIRLQELNQLEEDSDSESDDEEEDESNPSYAPAKNASSGLDREPNDAQEAAANLSSTLRNRGKGGTTAAKEGASAATASSSPRYGNTDTSNSNLQDREALLSAHRGEQESITSSLVTLAQQLRLSAQNFSMSLESEKEVVDRAGEGLDRNIGGMDMAGKTMGTLRRLTEGKGFFGRMWLYGYIAGLWLLALFVVFVMPKLRF
ncbi:hypothetical protein EJ08DRAFT_675638 [Tothia fuscella]|uniref:Synaptobrevin n=1 Tax=Tothia fuscella TaxID=1048955 RepID=A0A9P4P1K9_9PEZI|nr:hypothetical protein EJ08DRAFT_675638 [Tothia fuscella]